MSCPAAGKRPGASVFMDVAMNFPFPFSRRRTACAVLMVFGLPTVALAQGDAAWRHPASPSPERLDDVVVTATRMPQPLHELAGDVVVLDGRALQQAGVASVEDALRQQAGLQLARNGGPGQSAGYFLRGSASSGTVVLVDGVRVGSATLGQFDFSSLSLSQVERIEVVRGPASSLYGADAVGGVIQIITRRGRAGPPRWTGSLALGGYRSADGDLGVSGGHGPVDYALSVAHERSRGLSVVRPGGTQQASENPDRDGFRRTVGTFNLGYSPASGHRLGLLASQSRLDAKYDAAEYPPPDFVADASPDFHNRLDTTVLALDYAGRLREGWQTQLKLSESRDESDSGGRTVAHYQTTRRQLGWQNTLHLAAGQQLLLALEHLSEEAETSSYTQAHDRTNKALVAGYGGRFGPLAVQASLRRDDNSAYGHNTTGNLGGNLALGGHWTVRVLAGTSFRAPTFNDLYFPGYGVSTLRPERGRSAELGMGWQAGEHDASLSVYRNKVRDLIGYDPDSTGTTCPPGHFGCAANTSRATLQGATLAGSTRWQGWQLRASLDLLDATDDETGQRLNRRAARQGSVSVDRDTGVWRAGATLTSVGSRPDGTVRLGGYTVLDLRAGWRLDQHWWLESRLLNAADRDIEPVAGYRDLGRQFWLGVRWVPAGA